MNEHAPGYYAVIPAPIRYDDKIPANAKLLYSEISALIGPEGCCYASNSYFAKLYKLSERTISSLISTLQDNNYIIVKLERDSSGKIERRNLFLTASAAEGHPVEENFHTPRKYFLGGIENFFQYTNTSITDIERDKEKGASPPANSKPTTDKPKVSKVLKVQETFSRWLDEVGAQWPSEDRAAVEDAFAGLVEMRQKRKRPLDTERATKILCKNLAELSKGDPREMVRLLDGAVERGWLTVYPITGGSKPAPAKPKGGRVYECL